MKLGIFLITFLLVFTSCQMESQSIEYNFDECAHCSMKISDPHFGSEIVTQKRKIFKFDSAECMFNYISKNKPEIGLVLVTDYANPNQLIDATKATYLISENQPSPMGADLSAYKDKVNAEKAMKTKGGKLYSYNQMLSKYQK